MDLDSLTCSICFSEYDHEDHEPKVIPGCGHTLCSTCIDNLISQATKFECPFCKKSFKINKKKIDSQFLKNFALLQLLDDKKTLIPKDPLKTCSVHNSPIEVVCLDCKTQICYKCAFQVNHKNHSVEMVENFFSDVSDMVRDIESWAKKMTTHNEMVQRYIEIKHDNIIRVADTISSECINKIGEIVDHFYENIKSYFKDLKEGKITRHFPKLEDIIFSKAYIDQVEAKIATWKEKKNLEAGLGIKSINLKRIKSVIQDCEDPKQVKEIFNSLEAHFLGNFFNSLRNTIQEISTAVAKKQENLKSFFNLAKYTKINQEILVSSDPPKKGQKKLDMTNFKDCIEKARKIILDLKSTKDFQLDLRNDLLFGLWENSHIRSVSIKLDEPSINENLWSFTKALPCLLDVKILSIQSHGCANFTNDSMKALADALNTMRLRKLEIEVTNSVELDDEGLKSLGFALSNLSRLRGLTLVFDDCFMVTDSGFSRLAQAISRMRNIDHLKLSFQRCSGISVEGISILSQALTYSKELNQIELFFGLTKFDDEAMGLLAVTLSHLTDINYFCLDVHGCPELTDASMEDLADCVSELQSLQKINFSFMGCEGITEAALQDFENVLHGLPDLRPVRADLKEGRFDHKVVQVINEDDEEDDFEIYEEDSVGFNENSEEGQEIIIPEPIRADMIVDKEEHQPVKEDNKIIEEVPVVSIDLPKSQARTQSQSSNKPKEIIILDEN